MDVAAAIDAEAVPVTRTVKGGAYVDGKWIPATTSSATIRATVQPAKGRDLMDMPEGVRMEAQYIIWTRSPVSIDDLIGYSGETWRVCYVWPRPTDGFNRAAIGKK